MMVASSSLIKLDTTHIRYSPSLPDMAYHHHIRPINNGETYENQTADFPPNSYGSINDTRFTPLSSTESFRDYHVTSASSTEDNNRTYGMSTGTETFYSESRNSDSSSPHDRKSFIHDESQTMEMNHNQLSNKTFGCSRSPTQLSPPPKRYVDRSSPTAMQCDLHISDSDTPASTMPQSSLPVYDDSRYRSPFINPPNHCLDTKPIINHQSSASGMMGFTSTQSNQEFYKSSYMGLKQSDINGNEIVTYTSLPSTSSSSSTEERHYSHSSTSSVASKPPTPSRPPSQKSSKTPTKLQQQTMPNYFFDDDDDESWKICQVCGDKATGYHFNALTCEGCKGFFRRSMKNGKNFTCPYTGNCTITKSNRRQCQACRLDKCLRIGMKKECIMSHSEIQMKKNLMLNNRIKKNIIEWKPTEFTPDKRSLVELIVTSHCQTNNPPNISEEGIVVEEKNSNGASPASSTNSGFSDLISRMTQDIVATAPGQTGASKTHLQHFSAIMEFSIKEIIKFCKKIPGFVTLSLKDQITLLKSGCTEILFIKANYTYDRNQNALSCGPGKYYTRESFILGGMSEEYTDAYLQFHHSLSHMRLDDTELACICASTLFSSDRDELENRDVVERQQEVIVTALQAYTENTYHCQIRFPKIMAYLTRLRTLNWHISKTHKRLQKTEAAEAIQPLVLEVTPSV